MMWMVTVCLAGLLSGGAAAHPSRVLWLYNVHTGESLRVRPFGHDGRLELGAWRHINRLMRSRKTSARRTMHPRLIATLAHLQQRFGGRRIDIISGFRQMAQASSYHNVGRAADVRIRGVAKADLFAACRQLAHLGCGYYTQQSFVHIDVRSRSGLWVDTSKAGEPARYVASPRAWLAAHPP